MLCGRTSFLSRIKWLLTFSFSKTKRPFETGKCHSCLWCEYIENCMADYTYFVKPEIAGDFEDANWYPYTSEGLAENEFTEALLDDLQYSDYYPNADEDGMVDVSDYPFTK